MISETRVARLTPPISERDHTLGPANAPVTLCEYGDFECPHCKLAHPIVKKVMAEAGDILRFAYRHFPFASAHPHAQWAAEAAEAAGAQGAFWEMHDKLFENQENLEIEDLVRYAQELELDAQRVYQELMAETYAPRVREDFSSGVRSGVNGTPTFYINGVRHDEAWDAPALLAAIVAAAKL